ncbi:hypothetical protein ACFWPK_04225 [Nocardia sp. NPDC058519]
MNEFATPGPDGNSDDACIHDQPKKLRIDGADSWTKPTQLDARNS